MSIRIVAFEGLNRSGKSTQISLAAEALKQAGFKVATLKFPQRTGLIGSLICRHFEGDIEYDPVTLQYLLEADKSRAQSEIATLEELGFHYLLVDRYLLSGIAHGVARGLDVSWIMALQRPLRQPDLTIIYDLSVDEALRRSQSMVERDEQDASFLEKVRLNFLSWEGIPGYHVISANQEPQVIHEETMRLILPVHAPI